MFFSRATPSIFFTTWGTLARFSSGLSRATKRLSGTQLQRISSLGNTIHGSFDAVPQSWEGMVVSAPSIIQHDGLYYMFYTGFDDRVPGKQTVGLATSKDLFDWKRHPGNPVYEAPEWAERRPDGWIDCRDSHVLKYGDEFSALFTMVTTKEGKGAIALASSKNLTEWKDLGPAVVTFKEPESPRVFEHGGSYYMFISSAHGKTVATLDKGSENRFLWRRFLSVGQPRTCGPVGRLSSRGIGRSFPPLSGKALETSSASGR